MAANSHRLSILTRHEIDELYALPHFTDEERRAYFELGEAEQQLVQSRTTSVAAYLTLQLGYFKAKQQFFEYDQDAIQDDLRYILCRHFPDKGAASISPPSTPTRRLLQHSILDLFGFQLCDSAAKAELERRAQRLAMLSTQPIFILRETLQYLKQQRIVVPIYTFLQDMIGRVVSAERRRVSNLLSDALTTEISQQLDAMLCADESMYRISILKHESKDFSYKELRQESGRREFFAPVHEFARHFLETTGISTESGRYYASLVKFYTVYKLQRMPVAITRLYLLCFAYYRFRQINDNLIEAFIYLVDQYEQSARQAAEEAAQSALTDASTHLKAAGQILHLFVDDSIPRNASFASVRKKAFALLPPERFEPVSNYMRNVTFDKVSFEWSHYTALSPVIKRNVRHLFAGLEFAGRVEDAPLLEAVAFLQELFGNGKSPRQSKPSAFPTAFIPKNLQPHLYRTEVGKKKQLNVDRYEFLIYRLLRNALEAGDVFSNDSTEFRRFEDDLISDARWQHKDDILCEIGLPVLLAPIEETLATLHDDIEAQLKLVNHHIEHRDNPHIKVRQQGSKRRWGLVYPDPDESVNHSFYGQLPGIDVARLLWFVAERTGFLKTFTHVLDRYVKHDADPREILACVVAMGTNMGLRKMAEVSGIRPQVHSTDTHGTNQVNFWTLYTFDYQFAPRYRDLHKKIGSLVGRHPPGHYGNWVIKPSRKAYDELIVREWPNVQRIMVSLAQKDVTQATIVRKLSSYVRQNETKKALWELDNLCRTRYILRFINDVNLRQAVQKALNRGEAYHRLRRAIAYVNGGKLRVHTEAEQQLWNECSRLIANAIIHYNTALLSRVHEQKRAAGDHAAMELIASMSPVAWQHVNLFGSFEFGPAGAPIDIDVLAAYYDDPAYWAKVLEAASEPDER
jgi:hypothetical protein